MDYQYVLSESATEEQVSKIEDTEMETALTDTASTDRVRTKATVNGDLFNKEDTSSISACRSIDTDNNDLQNSTKQVINDKNHSENSINFDPSKVKIEIDEDVSYAKSREGNNLDTDFNIGCTASGDNTTHSSDLHPSNWKQESIKPEIDDETQVIVLNKHNKFNSRSKPDPSILRHDCDKCEEAFQFPYQLARHKNIKHEGKYPYSCDICKKPFDRISSLRDHRFVHTEDRPFECKKCEKRFKMKGNLKKHMREVHTEQEGPKLKFQCEYCSKIFPTKERLTSHFIVHDTEKAHACNVCGKKFNRKNNLKEHVVIHSTEKNFICPDCGMRFNRKYSLKIHARNHMEVKPYKCELCPSSFSQLHALKTHFRLHTGEKPFKCTICEKTFRQLATLQVHLKRHTGVKDFRCGICGKGFVIKRRLIEHERLHTGEKPFSCDICPYHTATSSGLRLHKKTHARQMKRLEMFQDENVLNEGSQSICTDGRKRKVLLKVKMPKSSVTTKKRKRKSAPVDKTESIDSNVDETNTEDSNIVLIENIDEVWNPTENDMTDVEINQRDLPEDLINDSLIEIVNDITDAEQLSTNFCLGEENIHQNGLENTIDYNNMGNLTLAEPQASKIENHGANMKRAIQDDIKKSTRKDVDFKNLTKEILYKHLNEFIPTIDADLLSAKINHISDELFETYSKENVTKPKLINRKKHKIMTKKDNKKPVSIAMDETVGIESTYTQNLCVNHIQIKPTECASTPKFPHSSTPSSNNSHVIRQLLSNLNPATTTQVPGPALTVPALTVPAHTVPALTVPALTIQIKTEADFQDPVKDKPFLSSTLRNMLVSSRPATTTHPSLTMSTQAAVLEKEVQTVYTRKAGSTGVLRDILSAPPKHYLVSTKNSSAAFRHSIQRKSEVAASINGFHGETHIPGKTSTEIEFPWVEEDLPYVSVPAQQILASIKIEPISP